MKHNTIALCSILYSLEGSGMIGKSPNLGTTDPSLIKIKSNQKEIKKVLTQLLPFWKRMLSLKTISFVFGFFPENFLFNICYHYRVAYLDVTALSSQPLPSRLFPVHAITSKKSDGCSPSQHTHLTYRKRFTPRLN